jgi:hypothetical protein
MRRHDARQPEHDVAVAAQDGLRCRAHPFEGDMGEVDTGGDLERLARHVR